MLKKENRLKKRKEFEEIKEKGVVVQSPTFGFAYLNKADEKKQFGFMVSKKISTKAVDRNHIRRMLAEAVKKNLEKAKPGLRGVFLTKRIICDVKYEEVEPEVRRVLEGVK